MITEKELSKKLQKIKYEEGLFGGRVEVMYVRMTPHIGASIDPRDYKVEIRLDPTWNPAYDKKTRKWMRRYEAKDDYSAVAEDCMRHETGHWKYCPKNTKNHAKIEDVVAEVLEQKGKENHIHRVTNMFEDLVVNTGLKKDKHNMMGQVLFWDDQLTCAESYDPSYEVFIKLHINANYRDAGKVLGRYFKNEERVNRAVGSLADHLGIERRNASALFEESDWPQLARVFAEEIAPFLDDRNIIEIPSNVFDDLIKRSVEKQKIAYEWYKKGKPKPRFMDDFDALDALYTRLARRIPIEATAEGSIGFPAIGYDMRPFNIEEDDFRNADITRITIDKEGNPVPSVPQRYFSIEVPMKVSMKKFPDFTVAVLDCSGSMTDGLPDGTDNGSTTYIPWGDNSKYHYAVLGWYGTIKDLEERGILPYINVGLVGFSGSTRAAKRSGNKLRDIKKIILNPEFGYTTLNIEKFSETLPYDRTSVVMTISDGSIHNWDEIKDKFQELIEPHIYFHIQLGDPTEVSNDIESWGKSVYHINNGEDLARLSQGLVVDVYKKYIEKHAKKVELPEVPK